MSMRKFMHPGNIYKVPPNFKELVAKYPEFKQHVTIDLSGKLKFNFKNEESLRVLTKILLKHDFQLDVIIPENKLVPALPLRLNYILWIEDLMKYAKIDNIQGIDIGTGAIAIYPLICAKMFNWRMIATDIDSSSVESALENIKNNSLGHLISVVTVNEQFILRDIIEHNNDYSFTVCNPPFFDLDKSDEMEKNLPPRNARTGNESELTVDGGEFSFVSRIIEESIELRNKVKMYTSMLGLKSNLLRCRKELKRRNIENSTWTEFCQGHTKRWGLAWSLLSKNELDLTNAPVIRTKQLNIRNKSKCNNTSELIVPLTEELLTVHEAITRLKLWINDLNIKTKEMTFMHEELSCWTCELCANEDTWSHARRKRRMLMRKEQNNPKKICLEGDTETKQANIPCATSNSTDTTSINSKEPYLIFNLAVGELNTNRNQEKCTKKNNNIKICLIYQSGAGGKNGLETFRQFLINKFEIREYLQQRRREQSKKSLEIKNMTKDDINKIFKSVP